MVIKYERQGFLVSFPKSYILAHLFISCILSLLIKSNQNYRMGEGDSLTLSSHIKIQMKTALKDIFA